jgi:hypothetical protein
MGSTLDTLAGVVIGVGAFEERILKIGFRDLLAHFKKPLPSTPGGHLQEQLKTAIENAIASAGPDGWLDWAIDYRNMLVHKGRRVNLHTIVQDGAPALVDATGVPILRARTVVHLARDPRNSDLQAYFGGTSEPNRLSNLLEEDGLKTLRSTLEAVVFLLKATCEALLRVWDERRKAPHLLPQPRPQWPDMSVQPDRFAGFEPGTVRVAPTELHSSPRNVQRLVAAAVDTNNRHRWRTFTG